MAIALATFEGMPEEFGWEDALLIDKLREQGAEIIYTPWTDPDADWASPELVVVRSPWDYPLRRDEFVAWVRSVAAPIENPAALIEWNSDKHYLGDLAAAGLPVVETTYVAPGDEPPAIERQVVIKPAVSAGARDTGRFGPASASAGRALIERICARGGTAMVQPFLSAVEETGETAVVMIAGEVSHVLQKAPVLDADEVAPLREDGLRVAERMYDPGLVVSGAAAADELALARQTLGLLRDRFGADPLIARVDMLRDPEGDPILLELEAIEPNLYFEHAPEAADRLADAILSRAAASY